LFQFIQQESIMPLIESHRVVVTGLGAITPLGNSVLDYWQGLLAGRSGIGRISHFDAAGHSCQIAAEVKGFDPTDFMGAKVARRADRFAQFAITASHQALMDADFAITNLNAEQVGVIMGSGVGGITVLETQQEIYLNQGPCRCSPFMIPMMIANMGAGLVAIHTGARGPNSCTVTACAAGANAIGEGFRIIQRGDAQAMICGGAEAAITPLSMAGFAAARVVSTRNEAPEQASRPFDRDRDGFVLGEGAGVLLLENLDHALKREARIYSEIVGYGLTCDAYHMTGQLPGGQMAARAAQLALKEAGLQPAQVDYINAHGTSTRVNDPTETAAIKTVLGQAADQVAISSTKSMTGHLLGGAGGIEAVATTLAIAHDQIPPTINLDHPDPECNLDYVAHRMREKTVNVALSNSYAFGGHNVTLAFRKFQQ
jgi:3-oxoacyl-[acyl-carrier-protein] synthase II